MIRAVFGIMAGLLCALAGMKHAAALNGDAARLARWVQLLPHLALLIREGALSIPEALCKAADGDLPPDRLLREMAARVHAAPLTTLSEAYAQCSADSTEKDALLRLFTRLSRGTKESRLLAVEQACEELQLLAAAATQKAAKDARLWQTLGFSGGVCVTLLLL